MQKHPPTWRHLHCLPALVALLLLATVLARPGHLVQAQEADPGPVLVKDINTNATPISSEPSNLIDMNGTLFFVANRGIHEGLWRSDGTAAGTTIVKHISLRTTYGLIRSLVHVNGTLFFGAGDGTHGHALWRSDGTADGTTLVKDINPGQSGSISGPLVNVNGTLFFGADDGTHGSELWKYAVGQTTKGAKMLYLSLILQ